jgi:small-conductance mechanosensitive channel
MVKAIMVFLYLMMSLADAQGSFAQTQSDTPPQQEEAPIEKAPVVIDGTVLFNVRGFSSFPAQERAKAIAGRIKRVASDPTVKTDSIVTVEARVSTDVVAGKEPILKIYDADAAIEEVRRQVLAQLYATKIRETVDAYRRARTSENMMKNVVYSLFASVIALVLLLTLVKLLRKLVVWLEERYKARVYSLHIKSFEIVQAERFWTTLMGGIKGLRLGIIVLLFFFYLDFVLSLFPQTRHIAANLLGYVLTPLGKMGTAVVGNIPNLIFLALLVVIIRYLLKLMRLFFEGVARKRFTISGFDPDWARPTYKIVRLFVIAFAIIVAYPYIPGSESSAFKGVSIFVGVIFSLGSSSAIGNIIAGYMLTYRRAFKVGDRVKINDVSGDVVEVRLQVTHLKTIKNEEIILPNSVIINSHVTNYSSLASERGLILHTTVTIGYDVPWRQVNALLLLAAERTEGILKEPRPFVLQKSLDDFCISYELNAYTGDPNKMAERYSDLHRHILDAFNEHNVQIMSPHYESDPGDSKVVPKERWYAPPAKPD